MSKLYVFGIGGTGSRVLYALTMLLGAGAKINATEVVPVIVDIDEGSHATTRLVKLLRRYGTVHAKRDAKMSAGFFRTPFRMDIVPDAKFKFDMQTSIKFGDFIGNKQLANMGERELANYALANALFSQKNLDRNMRVGFEGNPDIGSVVLNQFKEQQSFRDIVNSVEDGDRAFIISSIFGGTGASGFPLLLKNLRGLEDNLDFGNRDLVKRMPVGGLTVMPYFNVKQSAESPIDSSTFPQKTKAALKYYERNLKGLNALYYLGDRVKADYENNSGSEEQRNAPHFLELVGALSIIHFCERSNAELGIAEDGAFNGATQHYEFGIKEDSSPVRGDTLDRKTFNAFMPALTQMLLVQRFMQSNMDRAKEHQWARELDVANRILQTDYYRDGLEGFANECFEWLAGMAGNSRAFSPFNLDMDGKKLFELVEGYKPKSGLFVGSGGYDHFDRLLNDKVKEARKENMPLEAVFLELFHLATSEIVEKKINLTVN